MPYNISRDVCVRHKEVLRLALEHAMEGKSFTIPTRKKNRAAQIREALEAVKHHEEFKAFAGLKEQFIVSQKANTGYVEMKFIGTMPLDIPSTEEAPNDTGNLTPVSSSKPHVVHHAPSELHLDNILDLLGVISAATKLGERSDELFFPDANLPEDDKARLYVWSKASGWKYIDHEGAGLTLTKREVDDFLLWEPEGQ